MSVAVLSRTSYGSRDMSPEATKLENEATCTEMCSLHAFGFPAEEATHPLPHTVDGPLEDQRDVAARLYTPIKPWQTRLLLVGPGQHGSELISELHTAHITESYGLVLSEEDIDIRYSALSYCWGDPIYCRPLRVGGEVYPITENLFCALQRIRHTEMPLFFWIDAVCINQHDNEERSMQLRNMLSIYEKAAQVTVWLGEQSQHSDIVLQTLDVGDCSDGFVRRLCQEHASNLIRGLRAFVCRPWFRRIWVRQEVWAARRLKVQCGESDVDWEAIKKIPSFANVLREFNTAIKGGTDLPFSEHALDCLSGLHVASTDERLEARMADIPKLYMEAHHLGPEGTTRYGYKTVSLGSRSGIVSLLGHSTNCLSSEPNDRIYGLLSMSQTKIAIPRMESSGPAITVNHTKQPVEVYQELTKYVVNREESLHLLMLDATFGSDLDDGSKLPSWAIDWRRPILASNLVLLPVGIANHFPNGRGYRAVDSSRLDILQLRGYCIGHAETDVVLSRVGHRKYWGDNLREKEQQLREIGAGQDSNRKFMKLEFCVPALASGGDPVDAPSWYHLLSDRATGDTRPIFMSPGPDYNHKYVVPKHARPGDAVVLVEGSALPLLIRLREGQSTFTFVGPVLYPIDPSLATQHFIVRQNWEGIVAWAERTHGLREFKTFELA